jgi:hypothetical protein
MSIVLGAVVLAAAEMLVVVVATVSCFGSTFGLFQCGRVQILVVLLVILA